MPNDTVIIDMVEQLGYIDGEDYTFYNLGVPPFEHKNPEAVRDFFEILGYKVIFSSINHFCMNTGFGAAITWPQGDIGAAKFVSGLFMESVAVNSPCTFDVISKNKGLRGWKLYILWNDLCGKDYEKVEKLCKNCPVSILLEACGRRDFSGRELVTKYLE